MILTAFCYWTDYTLQHEEVDGDEESQKKAIDEDWRPVEKMYVELISDVLRMINYGLVFCLLDKDWFSKTASTQVLLISCSLQVMWILFTSRKVIFWLNILWLQNCDLKGWKVSYQIHDNMKEIFDKSQAMMTSLNDLNVEAKKQGIDLKDLLEKRSA